MPTLLLDHEQHLLIPDKATLCKLAHRSIGSFETFGCLILPKGTAQKFDASPGHYLVAGTDEDVQRIILPYKVEFVESFARKAGVAFRAKQGLNGSVYIGCVDSDQIRKDSTAHNYADLEKDIDWVAAANVRSFEELKNGDGFPLLTHVNACLKEDSFMKALKLIDTKAVSKWCQPGKFGANLRVAWTKAEQAMRKSQPKGPAQNAGTDAALEASCTELNEFYKETEMFVPYYDLPLHKRIVTMDPLPAVDINEATIQKLKKLLECAGPPPPPNNGCPTLPNFPNFPTLRHFPNNEVILEASQLQHVLAAINKGEGNLKGPSPLKRALRNSGSPAPTQPGSDSDSESEETPGHAAATTPARVPTSAAKATPGATRASGRTPGIKRYEPGDSNSQPTPKKAKVADAEKGEGKKEKKPRATGQGSRGGTGSRGGKGAYNTKDSKTKRGSESFSLGRGGERSQNFEPVGCLLVCPSSAGPPTTSEDKAELKELRKQLKEKDAEIARGQSELANEKVNVALHVSAAVEKVKAEMAIAATEAFQRGAAFAKDLMK